MVVGFFLGVGVALLFVFVSVWREAVKAYDKENR